MNKTDLKREHKIKTIKFLDKIKDLFKIKVLFIKTKKLTIRVWEKEKND